MTLALPRIRVRRRRRKPRGPRWWMAVFTLLMHLSALMVAIASLIRFGADLGWALAAIGHALCADHEHSALKQQRWETVHPPPLRLLGAAFVVGSIAPLSTHI